MIYLSTTRRHRGGFACIENGYCLASFREARGIIALEKPSAELLITALYNGNAIVLLEDNPCTMYKELSQKLPPGVLTIVPNTYDVIKTIASHKEVGCAIGLTKSLAGILPLNDSLVFMQTTNNLDDNYRKVTVIKNVWYDIGKSSTFNL